MVHNKVIVHKGNDEMWDQRSPWSEVKVTQSCPTLCDPWTIGFLKARILEWVAFPSSRGIFPTQGLNPGLLHCRQIVYQLNQKGSPRKLEWVAYPFYSGSSRCRNRTGVSCIAGGFFTKWAMKKAHRSQISNGACMACALGNLYTWKWTHLDLNFMTEPVRWRKCCPF